MRSLPNRHLGAIVDRLDGCLVSTSGQARLVDLLQSLHPVADRMVPDMQHDTRLDASSTQAVRIGWVGKVVRKMPSVERFQADFRAGA